MEHHKIIEPLKEVVGHIGNFVVDKVLGSDLFSDILNGTDNSRLDEPVFTQQEFSYDSEGNWHNPAPDIAGRDL
jgi:hypothetical protein